MCSCLDLVDKVPMATLKGTEGHWCALVYIAEYLEGLILFAGLQPHHVLDLKRPKIQVWRSIEPVVL